MRFPLHRACVVTVLVLSLGLHWSVLQSAAWVGMVVNYSRDGSLGEALEKTFDGEHPCALCHLVKAGASSDDKDDKRQSTASAVKKLDLALQLVERLIFSPPVAPEYVLLELRPIPGASEPAVPPPRAA